MTGVVMRVNGLYEDDPEKQQHAYAIQILAEGNRISEEEIYQLYEGVLREYKKEAKIKIFLPILVTKRVRELLDERMRALTLSTTDPPDRIIHREPIPIRSEG
jgi:hypothetical protein